MNLTKQCNIFPLKEIDLSHISSLQRKIATNSLRLYEIQKKIKDIKFRNIWDNYWSLSSFSWESSFQILSPPQKFGESDIPVEENLAIRMNPYLKEVIRKTTFILSQKNRRSPSDLKMKMLILGANGKPCH